MPRTKDLSASADNSFGRLGGPLMGGARRSGRIAKEIHILLFGTDTSGHIFSEETSTVVLSRHGAGIVSRHKVAADEVLTLRLSGTSAEAGVRLVGQMGQETRGYTYGVKFLDSDLDFWELKFPAPLQWHSDPDAVAFSRVLRTRGGIAAAADIVVVEVKTKSRAQQIDDAQLRLL